MGHTRKPFTTEKVMNYRDYCQQAIERGQLSKEDLKVSQYFGISAWEETHKSGKNIYYNNTHERPKGGNVTKSGESGK